MSVDQLLARVAPKGPRSVSTADGGALLALSLHCAPVWPTFPLQRCSAPRIKPNSLHPPPRAAGLMRKHGFAPVGGALAGDWNARFTDEWLFEFTRCAACWSRPLRPRAYRLPGTVTSGAGARRAGCANAFALHCSLQAATGKVFVHAREQGNSRNVQCLGLLLRKYIPEPALARPTWQGLPEQAEALGEMFAEYVTQPLLASAVPGPVSALQMFPDRCLSAICRRGRCSTISDPLTPCQASTLPANTAWRCAV